jgi:hypothetical protein
MAFSRKLGLRALIASSLSFFCASIAHGFVTYHNTERAKTATSAYVPSKVTVDTRALFGDSSGDQTKIAKNLSLQLPSGKRYAVTRAAVLPGLNDGKTFVGYFDSHGEDYRIFVTETQGVISGFMLSPEGGIDLSTVESGLQRETFLESRIKANRVPVFGHGHDSLFLPHAAEDGSAAIPEKAHQQFDHISEEAKSTNDRAKAGVQVTVDLLIVYNAGMVSRYGSEAGVLARLNTLVAITNSALAQSEVNLTIRLINATQVSFPDATTIADALTAISPRSTNAIKGVVDSLRDQHKADLVALIRPHNTAVNPGNCGLAWILGSGGSEVSSVSEYGFSVVGDGNDVNGSNSFCPETSLAHELGHNFGLVHDRISAPSQNGATNYGRGYLDTGAGFATIMAEFTRDRIARFSNPNTTCLGAPCGVSRTDIANSADSAGAILTTMDAIAAFRTAVVVDPNADADADGIPNGIEAAEGRQANIKDNAIFAGMATNSDRLFAMQQYRDFLGREADTAGLAGWTEALRNKSLTREQVIKSFFDSQEFQNGVPSIARLYLGYFKRIPDHAGLLGWVGAYRGGQALNEISAAFSSSAEFQQTYGALNNTQFVTLVYRNVLDRAPDAAGLNGWVDQLNAGATRGQIMIGFTESQEFKNRTNSSVEVIMMYEGMLRRAAESAGHSAWVDYLNAGNTSLPLISGFLNSLEYRNRFLP